VDEIDTHWNTYYKHFVVDKVFDERPFVLLMAVLG
jgi:hypothetical protein